MHRRISSLVAAAALGIVLPGTAVAQAGNEVAVVDSSFQPASLTITAGEAVTWTSSGSLPHTVTSSDGDFDSNSGCASFSDGGSGACMDNGETYSFTFDTPGTYAYYCKLHGTSAGGGMAGTIVVQAAGAQVTETATEDATEDDGAAVTGAMTVSDQSGDGTRVTVASVTITGADGFVVVHSDADGSPGPVIGHVAIDEGTSTNVRVTLDTPLAADATVWPMLHVDAGTAGTYEFPGADGPVSDGNGVVVRPLAYTVVASGALASTGPDGVRAAALVVLAVLVLIAGVTLIRRREAA
jgi:plastocyanin